MIACLGTTPTIQRTMMFASLMLDVVNRATRVEEYASGKSINVARVLRTMGHEVTALGFEGGDRGAAIRRELDLLGIDHDFIHVDTQTRLCTTVIDEQEGHVTELVEESAAVQNADYFRLFESLERCMRKAELLVLSGSLPPGAPVDLYARCLKIADGKMPVILDAVGPCLVEALPLGPTLIKPNANEIARTLGIKTDSDDSLRDGMLELTRRGAGWVAVTRGAESTLLTDGKSLYSISTPRIEVVNPIGSGDSFAAGLAAGIARGQSIPQACRLAVACGAANAMTLKTAHVDREVVTRLIAEIAVSQIDL